MGDPEVIVPVFGMITGILTIGFMSWGLVRVASGPVGQALARRVQGRHADGDMAGDVEALREQVEVLQQQLAETQERVDFTERLLARQERGQLPGGNG